MNENFDLVKDLIKTKLDLDIANKNFEIAEAEMIDYYAYQIKANKSKLDYLLKKIKKIGLILDISDEINIKQVI